MEKLITYSLGCQMANYRARACHNFFRHSIWAIYNIGWGCTRKNRLNDDYYYYMHCAHYDYNGKYTNLISALVFD